MTYNVFSGMLNPTQSILKNMQEAARSAKHMLLLHIQLVLNKCRPGTQLNKNGKVCHAYFYRSISYALRRIDH